MIHPITEFKEEQKKLAEQIKKDHDEWDSHVFRHNHIAYCELRGRTREQIEIPRENNEPDETYIGDIKDKWKKKLNIWRTEYEKTLCVD